MAYSRVSHSLTLRECERPGVGDDCKACSILAVLRSTDYRRQAGRPKPPGFRYALRQRGNLVFISSNPNSQHGKDFTLISMLGSMNEMSGVIYLFPSNQQGHKEKFGCSPHECLCDSDFRPVGTRQKPRSEHDRVCIAQASKALLRETLTPVDISFSLS